MADCLQLKKSNCKNCYKCIRHCPVKSIRFSDNQAHIISNACVLCGECILVCPQNARQIVNDVGRVKAMLRSGNPVYVSIAPSFIANYDGAGIESMRTALKSLGFADVEETAIGATMVKNEYERLIREEKRDILITSCCHSLNLLVQKHFPSLLPYLADVYSPMQAHCIDIKKRHPGCRTVFIGPCLAKKDEAAMYPGIVDAVLTFDELSRWFEEDSVVPEKVYDITEESRARFFPTPGGVMKTMTEFNPDYTYMAVDGMENCIQVLQDVEAGNVHNCFLEMNACYGSCIGGPAISKDRRLPVKEYMLISKYAGRKDFVIEQPTAEEMHKVLDPIDTKMVQPTEAEIQETLRKMGKFSKADELNCGSCGYDSCYEKAIAICQGKAEADMCLPYLMRRTQSFSDNIVAHAPSSILLLNNDLEIQMINPSACKLFDIDNSMEAIGRMITDYLDPEPFLNAMMTRRIIEEPSLYLETNNKYVQLTVVYEQEHEQYMALLTDITEKEIEKQQRAERSRQTAEIADKVVEKQLRIVQEIANLLGETAAETKVALFELKESVSNE